jgi:hypothetical protein
MGLRVCIFIGLLPSANFESIAAADDPTLAAALERYHREGKTSNAEIKLLLKRDTDVDIRQVIELIQRNP